jgi:hypothetical protein
MWCGRPRVTDERRTPVEDQDKIQTDDEVEAHKKKVRLANEEGGESSEDFELHKKKVRLANEEGGESSEDDFELHKKRH